MRKHDFSVSSLDIRREIAQEIRLLRQSVRVGVRSTEEGIAAIWALRTLGEVLGVVPLSSTHQMFVGNYKGDTE